MAAQVTLRTTDKRAANAAIKAGADIGYLSQYEAEGDNTLVEIHATRSDWSTTLWLVTHVDLHRATKVQALLTFLKDQVARGRL